MSCNLLVTIKIGVAGGQQVTRVRRDISSGTNISRVILIVLVLKLVHLEKNGFS